MTPDELVSDIAIVIHGTTLATNALIERKGARTALVLASDPVTLAADSLSRYAVLVNANDVATSGAAPASASAVTRSSPMTSVVVAPVWTCRPRAAQCA